MNKITRTASLVALLVFGSIGSSFAKPLDTGHWPIVITPSVSSAAAGSPVSFEIGMSQSGSSPTTVYLSSDNPWIFPVPASVTVPTGETTAYVPPSYEMYQSPGSPTYVTVTATVNGHSTQTQVLVY